MKKIEELLTKAISEYRELQKTTGKTDVKISWFVDNFILDNPKEISEIRKGGKGESK